MHAGGEGNCRAAPDPEGGAGMPTAILGLRVRVSIVDRDCVTRNGQGSLGVKGSLAMGGKELFSPCVVRAKNWVWVK